MQNPTCVGLDTQLDYLPDDMREGVETCEQAADAIIAFNKKIVDSVCDIVPAVKVQVAYYEQYGCGGPAAFLETVNYAKEKGTHRHCRLQAQRHRLYGGRYSAAYLGETAINGQDAARCRPLTS